MAGRFNAAGLGLVHTIRAGRPTLLLQENKSIADNPAFDVALNQHHAASYNTSA